MKRLMLVIAVSMLSVCTFAKGQHHDDRHSNNRGPRMEQHHDNRQMQHGPRMQYNNHSPMINDNRDHGKHRHHNKHHRGSDFWFDIVEEVIAPKPVIMINQNPPPPPQVLPVAPVVVKPQPIYVNPQLNRGWNMTIPGYISY